MWRLALAFLLFTSISCEPELQELLIGQWRGIDDAGNEIYIHFTPEGQYLLSVNGSALVPDDGPLRYELQVSADQRDVYVDLYDERQPSGKTRLLAQPISADEMRLSINTTAPGGETLRLTKL